MNQVVFDLIYKIAHRGWFLDGLIVFFAQYLAYLIVASALFMIFRLRTWKEKYVALAYMALSVMLSRGIITNLIRAAYPHPRPNEFLGIASLIPESGASFPSGHAAFFFALAMAVYFLNRRLGIIFFVLSFVMGIARVATGVHWPLDILGGMVLGVLCGYLIHLLLRSYAARVKNEVPVVAE